MLKLIKMTEKYKQKLGEMIEEWNGVLENEFVNSDGEIEQRYWIFPE